METIMRNEKTNKTQVNISEIDKVKEIYHQVLGQHPDEHLSILEMVCEIKFHYEFILGSLPQSVYWKDVNAVYLGGSKGLSDLVGVKDLSDIVGMTDYDFEKNAGWPKGTADIFRKDDFYVIKNNKIISKEEKPFNTASGEIIYQLTSKVPLLNKDKKVIGVIGIATDITNLKLAQEELAKTKALVESSLQNAIEHIPGSIYWKNREGIYQGCNQTFAVRANLESPKEIVGKTDKDMPWKGDGEIEKLEQEVIEQGISKEIEETNTLSNGEKQVFLTKKSPLFDNKRNIIGIISVSFDITERKRVEEEKLNMMMSLAASIAHEIRTPLATVDVSAEYINDYLPILIESYKKLSSLDGNSSEIKQNELNELEKSPEIIQNEALAANTFVDIMLMNLKPKIGRQEVFLITDAITEALSRYPFQDDERNRVFCDDTHFFKVKGSQLLIVHVLFNLLKNALYYTHTQGQIKIWLEKNNNKYNKLYFKDTGKGIPKDILPHIFDQFFSRTYHGTGIGLTYCKIVMDSLGGSIICDSIEGSYTQFILNFPVIT